VTQPLQQPSENPRVNWLLRYITVQQLYDTKIVSALQAAEYDAGEAAKQWEGMNIGDRAKRYQIKLVQNEIREIIKGMFKDLVPVINKGQQDAAEAAAKAALAQDAKVLEALFPDPELRKAWKASYVQQARHGVAAMITRILESHRPLSKQVYKTAAFTTGRLDRKINSALARGASAKELAKLVRSDISPKVAGGVSYAAMRLGRTEINNAFHAMSIGNAQDDPWVEEMVWNLSKSHYEQGCRCEEYADTKFFPKTQVPDKPHPQCLCFVTRKSMEWNDFAVQLAAGGFDDYYESKYGHLASA
jgi:hypothetical protein